MNAVRVCLAIPTLLHGGAENVVVALANGMVKQGMEVTLLNVSGKAGLRFSGTLAEKATIESLDAGPYTVGGAAKFRRFVAPAKFDCVIGHLTPLLLLLAALPGDDRPSIVFVEHSSPGELPRARVRTAVLKGPYKRMDAIVTVSQDSRNKLLAINPDLEDRVEVIYNGIDARAFGELVCSTDRAALRREWGIPATAIVAGVIGRLEPIKGVGEFLRALENVSDLVLDTGLFVLIAGDGGSAEGIRRMLESSQLKERIKLLGMLDNVQAAFAASDIIIIPSKSEGLPMVLLEALAAGRPVISMSVGGITEILEGNRGVLVAAGEYGRLVRELLSLTQVPAALRRDLGARGARWIEEHCSAERMVASYIELISHIAR